MKLKKKVLRAIQINNVPSDVFDRIMESLKHILTRQELKANEGSNHGGWCMPLALSEIAMSNDGEGHMYLFPAVIEYRDTRCMIEEALDIKLTDYDVIEVNDDR